MRLAATMSNTVLLFYAQDIGRGVPVLADAIEWVLCARDVKHVRHYLNDLSCWVLQEQSLY